MTYDPEIHHRRSIRLKEYDYSQTGAYFVTVCAWKKENIFGDIKNSEMLLNEYGEIVMRCWDDLPSHYHHAQLDEFVIMPNHVHGIIVIDRATKNYVTTHSVGAGLKPARVDADNNDKYRSGLKPAPTRQHGLPEIVRAFKTFSSRHINETRDNPGVSVWQRNYYERIIRDGRELHTIREYIRYNPLKWDEDEENSNMKGRGNS